MNTQSFKTSETGNSWIVVDAKNKTLGRLATKIAFRLVGKHKPEFTPNADLGDYVIVINAEKINVTGQKLFQKKYYIQLMTKTLKIIYTHKKTKTKV